MASISKHQKTEDRISNLPTNLLTHILSLLPTKDVVRTSTLSTYWKEQWMSISHLDLNDEDFFSPRKTTVLSPFTRTSMTKTMFVNFVNQMLRFVRVTRLDLFQLKCHEYYDEHVNAWLSAALSRDVQQLDLNIPLGDQRVLPPSLFTSTTLLVLKLSINFVLRVPTTVSLESLKILQLQSVEFEDDDSLSRFISGCPVLEDLDMQGSIGTNVKVINISSLGLKRLILEDFDLHCDDNHDYEIVLNTPNLQYFQYADNPMPETYSIESLRHLIKADIFLGRFRNPDFGLRNIFVIISNVQNLYLSSNYIQDSDDIDGRLPNFPHLTYLKIYAGILLTNFLESAPHLQTLAFDDEFDDTTGIMDHWCPPTSVPSCMLFHLKVIEIPSFSGEEEEFHIVRYFLDNSEVLEELRIRYSFFAKRQEAAVSKKLLDLPRASRSCRIVLT